MRFYDQLRAEIPPSLVEHAPDPGPRAEDRPARSTRSSGSRRSRTSARPPRRARSRRLKGLSAKTESLILAGIARPRVAPARACSSIGRRSAIDGAHRQRSSRAARRDAAIEPAGSFRRQKETIGDLDLLAETDDPKALMDRFLGLGAVDAVIGKGDHKAAVRLLRGPQVDLMAMPPGEAGPVPRPLHRLEGAQRPAPGPIARDRGWSLSEYGFLRIGEDGEPLTGDAAELRTFATEEEAYAFLDLPFIEPELREDDGEIEAALAGTLPTLITQADLRGDCHTHSEWSDGAHADRDDGRGLPPARLRLPGPDRPLLLARDRPRPRPGPGRAAASDHRRAERPVRAARSATARRRRRRRRRASASSTAASSRSGPTASLDYDDDLLARFDVVVASVHVSRRQPRAELTRRTLNAIRSPHVDIIAHPSGRMIQSRDDLDLDWEAVYAAAAATGTALEMNGSPHRLDLSVERARRAVAAGCILTIDSDAHSTRELDYVRWGVTQARRAWVEPRIVLNTRSRAELLEWVAGAPARVDGLTATIHPVQRSVALEVPADSPRPRPARRRHRRAGTLARRPAQLGGRRSCCWPPRCSGRSRSSASSTRPKRSTASRSSR